MNKVRLFGIIALIAVFGFSLASCGGGGGGGGGRGHLGSTLNLSGQVWTVDRVDDDRIIWERFTGNRSVSPVEYWHEWWCEENERWEESEIKVGGSGSIIEGHFTFTIGTPSETKSIMHSFFNGEVWSRLFTNLRISDSSTRLASVGGFSTYTSPATDYFGYLSRWMDTETSWEEVFYIFVDRDVTITAGGRTLDLPCSLYDCGVLCLCEEELGGCDCGGDPRRQITSNLNLNLRTGWNAFFVRTTRSFSGGMFVERVSFSMGDSGHSRWVLDEWWNDFGLQTYCTETIQGFSEATEYPGRRPPPRSGVSPFRAIR